MQRLLGISDIKQINSGIEASSNKYVTSIIFIKEYCMNTPIVCIINSYVWCVTRSQIFNWHATVLSTAGYKIIVIRMECDGLHNTMVQVAELLRPWILGFSTTNWQKLYWCK